MSFYGDPITYDYVHDNWLYLCCPSDKNQLRLHEIKFAWESSPSEQSFSWDSKSLRYIVWRLNAFDIHSPHKGNYVMSIILLRCLSISCDTCYLFHVVILYPVKYSLYRSGTNTANALTLVIHKITFSLKMKSHFYIMQLVLILSLIC